MKMLCVCFLTVFLIVAACDGKTEPAPPAEGVRTVAEVTPALTQAQRGWREDLTTLREALPRRHKNLFASIDEATWRRDAAQLDAELGGLNEVQLLARLARLVASVGEGHTAVGLYESSRIRRYPIILYEFSDGMYATEVAAEHGGFRGKKLVGIGDMSIEEVKAAVAPLIARDNDAQLRNLTPTLLVMPELLEALGAIPDPALGRFIFEGGEVLALEPVKDLSTVRWEEAKETPPRYRQKRQMFYWNDYLPEHELLYFKYNRCANAPSPQLSFAGLVEGTLGFMRQKLVTRFVVDLRDNGGGDSSIAAPLIEALGRMTPAPKIFVLIGRGTFSSAILNTLALKRVGAVLVGEETGGRPEHYGEVKHLTLPSLGVSVSYSTKYFSHEGISGNLKTLTPDVIVETSGADFFSGRDPVLEAVQYR